jgi:glutamyl/glutaminyl-tRNA synthetase
MLKPNKAHHFKDDFMTHNIRFAPSPTGYLHEGHLLSALYVWAMAKLKNYHIHLRIEDHDLSRARNEYIDSIYEDLEWFGLEWDSESKQSDRHEIYETALKKLNKENLIYGCHCSRKSLSMENPSSPDGEVIYQKHCLNKALPITSPNTIRLKVESTLIQWNDLRLGFFEENPALQCGDFALKDRLGQWTYQFAVVIDDMEENIGMIVRGEDLRNSTARQILLMSLLGKTTPPLYFHHSLLYDPQTGLKLSKRQQSQSLRAERMNAIAPEEILGRLCFKQHLIKNKCSISLNDAILLFSKQIEGYLQQK